MTDDAITGAELSDIGECIASAAYTLKRMPDRERSLLFKGERGQQWPMVLRDRMEHGAWSGAKVRLPPPNAADISRMDTVLDWLLDLAKQDAGYCRVVWLCYGERRKIEQVAKIMGVHRQTVRAWRNAGLLRIAQQRRAKDRARTKETWRPKKR